MEYTQPGIIKEQLELIKGMVFAQKVEIPVWRTRKARYTAEAQSAFAGAVYVPDDLEVIELA